MVIKSVDGIMNVVDLLLDLLVEMSVEIDHLGMAEASNGVGAEGSVGCAVVMSDN